VIFRGTSEDHLLVSEAFIRDDVKGGAVLKANRGNLWSWESGFSLTTLLFVTQGIKSNKP